jgi:hypothetical protein
MEDGSTPASSLAGLSRELRELMGAQPGALADPVDDLRVRRDRKRAQLD